MGNWRFCLLFFRKTSWTLPLPFAALREFENHPLFKLLEVTDMSKNQEERANYYLNIDGQAVPVSEQIYRVYQHYERKEEYFSYDLKTEKFQKETASFLPSREDSYERCWKRTGSLPLPVNPWRNRRSRLFGWRNWCNVCQLMRESFSTSYISRTSQNGLPAWSLEFPKQLCISAKSSCFKN